MPRTAHRLTHADRQEQILAVAERLFARLGFQGTTTRQIAERAGVNEALLFRHFPTKEKLYWAVIQGKCRCGQDPGELEEKLRSSDDDRAVFRGIAEEILRRSAENPAMLRLLLYSGLENHRLSRQFYESFLAERYELLAAHIRRRIEQGAFRHVDPLLAARSFVGMVIYHILIQELFRGKDYQDFEPSRVSETITDMWFEGMNARPGPRAPLNGVGRKMNGMGRRHAHQ
ncbi:MAG: TetR/AcrR family transcriptional regulator [Terriglobia bacterium]